MEIRFSLFLGPQLAEEPVDRAHHSFWILYKWNFSGDYYYHRQNIGLQVKFWRLALSSGICWLLDVCTKRRAARCLLPPNDRGKKVKRRRESVYLRRGCFRAENCIICWNVPQRERTREESSSLLNWAPLQGKLIWIVFAYHSLQHLFLMMDVLSACQTDARCGITLLVKYLISPRFDFHFRCSLSPLCFFFFYSGADWKEA